MNFSEAYWQTLKGVAYQDFMNVYYQLISARASSEAYWQTRARFV